MQKIDVPIMNASRLFKLDILKYGNVLSHKRVINFYFMEELAYVSTLLVNVKHRILQKQHVTGKLRKEVTFMRRFFTTFWKTT
jgi:hypothetical protein